MRRMRSDRIAVALLVAVCHGVVSGQESPRDAWSKLNAELVGTASKILCSDDTRFLRPQRLTRLKGPLGPVFALRTTNDGNPVFLLIRKQTELQLVTVNSETGESTATIASQPITQSTRRDLWLLDDGKQALLFGENGDELRVYDTTTAKLLRTIRDTKDNAVIYFCSLSADERTMVGSMKGGTLGVWDIVTGDMKSKVAVEGFPDTTILRVYPGPSNELVLVSAAVPGPEPKVDALLVRLIDGKIAARREMDGTDGLLASFVGTTCYRLRQSESRTMAWTMVETWDRKSLQTIDQQQLDPPVTTGALQMSPDGRFLFMLEYMVQPILIRDLSQKKWAGVVAPGVVGTRAFDVSPDGRKLVGYMGEWSQGTLIPDRIGTFDVHVLSVP